MENSYQRSHTHEDSQVDAFEYAPSDEDISLQLREKVRAQALRLRSLEKYKRLCEDRISQLCPNHPLPVTPEHLRTSSGPSTYDLHLSKQKINRLEQQISQSHLTPEKSNGIVNPDFLLKLNQDINELQKDNSLLEESLRAEMLASEEQRTYIEVLKQALEAKMENLGLSSFTPEEFSDYAQARTQIEKIRVEAAKYQNTILDQEAYIKSLAQEYKTMETDCLRLINERKEIEKQLEDAAEALQLGEDEVRKLEEEKSALLDYADEKARIEQDMSDQIEDIAEKYENLKAMHERALSDLKKQRDLKDEIENDLQNTNNEAARQERSAKDIKENYENAKSRILDKDNTIKKLKDELRVLTAKNESFQANNSTLTETLKETQNELDSLQTELEDSKDKCQRLSVNNEGLSNQLNKLKTDKEQADLKITNLKIETKHEKEINENLGIQLRQLNSELQTLQAQKQEMAQKDKINLQKITDLAAQMNHMQEEIELIYRQNSELGEENAAQREEIGIANMKIVQLNNEKELIHSELTRVESALKSDIRNTRNLSEDITSLKIRIDEQNRALNLADESFRDKQMRCQNIEFELQKTLQNLKHSQEEAEKEKFAKLMLNEDLKHKNTRLEDLEKELQNLQKEIDNCFRIIPKQFEISNRGILTLQNYLKNVEDENNMLTRKLYSATQEKDQVSRKLNEISSDNVSKETDLLDQVETLYKENSYLRDNINSQTSNMQNEIKSLHDMIQNLQVENSGLREQGKLSSYEINQLRNALESNGITTRTLEEKVNLLNSEKAQLQSLVLRIQRTLGTNELQRLYFELMRVRGDLEIAEREKLRLEGQLLRLEREENANLMQKETLKAKIKGCDTQIYSFKRKIQNLEEELNLEENDAKNKDRSFDNIRTVKKTLVYPESGRNTPSRSFRTESLLNKSPYQPRFCDSPDKFKSSFQA